MELFTDLTLPAALWVDSASNRNESQEYYLLGRKGDQHVGLTTLPPLRTESLEFWEPQLPGTLRASPGIALHALQCPVCRASMFSVMGYSGSLFLRTLKLRITANSQGCSSGRKAS